MECWLILWAQLRKTAEKQKRPVLQQRRPVFGPRTCVANHEPISPELQLDKTQTIRVKTLFFLHSLQRDRYLLARCSDRNSPAVHWCVVIASFDQADVRGHPLPSPQHTLLLSCCSAAKVLVGNNFSWKTKWVLQQSEHNKRNTDSERPANGNSLLHLKGWY